MSSLKYSKKLPPKMVELLVQLTATRAAEDRMLAEFVNDLADDAEEEDDVTWLILASLDEILSSAKWLRGQLEPHSVRGN